MFVLNTAVEILLLLVQFLHDFDLILFADLHSWSTETTFARSYLAFAHFFPCRGQQKSPQRRDWFLFENFSNLALMMECACSILKITTNCKILSFIHKENYQNRRLDFVINLLSFSFIKWEISLMKIGQIQIYVPIVTPRGIFVMTTNCWSKSTMFFRTSLVQHFFFKVGTNLLKGPGQKRWSVITRTDSNCELKDAT